MDSDVHNTDVDDKGSLNFAQLSYRKGRFRFSNVHLDSQKARETKIKYDNRDAEDKVMTSQYSSSFRT